MSWKLFITEHLKEAKRPLIVVLGPTASGKTAFSLEAAAYVGNAAEIVNADSRQLYKHLNVGTAKIMLEEMQGVPHHLLNVHDPKEKVTVAWYKERATKVIDEILDRGHVPMLVGGSMLYISAIIDGLDLQPKASSEIRERLTKEYEKDSGETLHKQLTEIDPESATGIPVQNMIYLIRALEIFESTGRKPSEAKTTRQCPYDLLILGISRPREELMKRINARTKELFQKGWSEEVRGLMKSGYGREDPGIRQTLGYSLIMEHLKTGKPLLEEIIEMISVKTRQYAKRQMTWWRRDPRIKWQLPDHLPQIFPLVSSQRHASVSKTTWQV